jgi:hypothetical protein
VRSVKGLRAKRETCSSQRGMSVTSYGEVIRDYILRKRKEAAAELEFFRQQPSLGKAIYYGARSITPCGKRHPHQRRRRASTLAAAERRLLAVKSLLRQASSFTALHDVIHAAIRPIRGIGSLTIYDIATRIGGYVGLEPKVVYLHAGTAEGAKALGLSARKTLCPKTLPRVFHRLRPREIEDCLCIYASDLWRLRSNKALQQAGARVARSGC